MRSPAPPSPDPAPGGLPVHPWRTLRVLKSWSQGDVARAAKCDRAHYSRIESGDARASARLTQRFVAVLGPGVPIQWPRLMPYLFSSAEASQLVPAPVIDAHTSALRLLGPFYQSTEDLVAVLGLNPGLWQGPMFGPPVDIVRGLMWWGCAGIWSWTGNIPQAPTTEREWREWFGALDHEAPIPMRGPAPDYGRDDILAAWQGLDAEARDLLIALARQLARNRGTGPE